MLNIESIRARINEVEGCWVWEGSLLARKYPIIQVQGRTTMVARALYELVNLLELPRGTCVHASCGNTLCVNPDHQELLTGMKATRQDLLEERAASQFWDRTSLDTETGCMLWEGHVMNGGYGAITIGNRRLLTHRYALELSTGQPVPEHLVVMHTCDTPRCVNPEHLRAGTQGDNVRDMHEKRRSVRKQTHKTSGKDRVVVRSSRALLTNEQVLDIRARYAAGETQVALGKEFGVSNDCIHLIVTNRAYKDLAAPEELPVIRGKDNVLLEQDVLDIIERHTAGETQAHLARQYGVTQTTIWHILKDRGGFVPKPKLTQEQVQQIRDVLATGAQQRAVARQFNVSEATISKIANTPVA